jgi:hypothetical protein
MHVENCSEELSKIINLILDLSKEDFAKLKQVINEDDSTVITIDQLNAFLDNPKIPQETKNKMLSAMNIEIAKRERNESEKR